MDSPIIIIWVYPKFILGVLGVILIFISFFDEISLCKQNSPIHRNNNEQDITKIRPNVFLLFFFAQNIDCGYTLELEPPNEYPKSMF